MTTPSANNMTPRVIAASIAAVLITAGAAIGVNAATFSVDEIELGETALVVLAPTASPTPEAEDAEEDTATEGETASGTVDEAEAVESAKAGDGKFACDEKRGDHDLADGSWTPPTAPGETTDGRDWWGGGDGGPDDGGTWDGDGRDDGGSWGGDGGSWGDGGGHYGGRGDD